MKKALTIIALILALTIITGCAASNIANEEANFVMVAAETEAAPLSMDEAQSIALNHAGASQADTIVLKTEYDRKENLYEVEFLFGDYEYDYEIHATAGEILACSKEYEPSVETKAPEAPTEKITEKATEKVTEKPTEKATEKPTEKATKNTTEKSSSVIGKDRAKAIALEHAGVSASKATNVKVEYDKEDRKYDVEFCYNNYEYDYEIHHTSGKILSHDTEYDAPPEKVTEKATEKATESSKIGKDKATAIALKHAGLSSGEVRELQVEYDKDDGVPVYDVEFESGNREYSYEIHAETGKIRSHEIDD